MSKNLPDLDITTLGGGCFWCLEAVYTELRGVLKVESGYSGGTVKNPSYEQVLFTDPIGPKILGVVAVMQLIGGLIIWKIVNIEV